MKVSEIMTPDPACCTPETSLPAVARLFVDHDCGAVPVVDSLGTRKPLGIVTDRDIACRAVAVGKNALELTARDCMSAPVVTVSLEASLNDCCEAMEKNRVRRVLVVDRTGACCGIVAQADIAVRGKESKAAEVVKQVSEPTSSPSAIPS
jgi:CBS domain-containing protein